MDSRKYRPSQCPTCRYYRPAVIERDPGIRDVAPWTKNRCTESMEYWWDSDKELVGSTNRKCAVYNGYDSRAVEKEL